MMRNRRSRPHLQAPSVFAELRFLTACDPAVGRWSLQNLPVVPGPGSAPRRARVASTEVVCELVRVERGALI